MTIAFARWFEFPVIGNCATAPCSAARNDEPGFRWKPWPDVSSAGPTIFVSAVSGYRTTLEPAKSVSPTRPPTSCWPIISIARCAVCKRSGSTSRTAMLWDTSSAMIVSADDVAARRGTSPICGPINASTTRRHAPPTRISFVI